MGEADAIDCARVLADQEKFKGMRPCYKMKEGDKVICVTSDGETPNDPAYKNCPREE